MRTIKGIAASAGVAFGSVRFVASPLQMTALERVRDPDRELVRLEWAREAAKQKLEELCAAVGKELGPECEKIFQIQLMMLDDGDFRAALRRAVQDEGFSAPYAVRRAAEQLTAMFAGMEDAYMRARLADIQDLGIRLLHALDPDAAVLPELPAGSVAAAPFFTPSQVMGLAAKGALGFVTREGSRTSHAAILARLLGIPAVAALSSSYSRLYDGGVIIADGFTGDVVIDPDEKTSEAYRAFERRPNIGEETLAQLRTLPSRTRGGRAVKILAKIWKPSDLPLVIESGAEGVGLFRTESFYRNRTDFPTEDEQYRIYCSLAKQLGSRPLTIRTATHDGRVRSLAEEMNPAMGVRGIRFSFENPELFRTQLRALLRAAADHNIAVTFPMVTSAEELRRARRALLHVKEELKSEGVPFGEAIPVGVLIDTPAAALVAEELAREADFFDIGTNGLTQFALAADRSNPEVSPVFDFQHPAVLELVRRAVLAAKNAGIPAVICGDAAGDPRLLSYFLGLGVEALVVAPSSVLELRRAVRAME